MAWKDVEFGGSDSAERVRRLQAFCAASPSEGSFDALLIIGGVDSYHSTVSQAVLKYLFLGSSGQELLGEQVISQEHDRVEDVVLLLTRHRISIFYSSESDAAVKILPMISQWHNVTEYTFHDGMDPDEQENRKIRAFKQMVSGVKRIGIPYGVAADGKDLQDVMIPEKWPIVQSFGLEDGANGKGFFTMNHHVVNVTTLLREELAKLDDFSAKRVATEVAPMLTHHYNQFLMKLDHAETPAVRVAKSESEIGEDLQSFYDFGTTQYEARGLKTADHRGSRVLFGQRTSQAASAKASSSVFLHNAGSDSGPATHMLVQSEDPFSGVRFTRTYFLATGKTAPRVVDEDALVQQDTEVSAKHPEDKDNSVDTRVLIELYSLLLRGFRVAVRSFTHQASKTPAQSAAQCLTAAKAEALREIKDAMRSSTSSVLHGSTHPADFLDQHLVIDAESLDGCGRETSFPAQKWNLLYLSLEIKQIPSQLAASEMLGSLVVGDSLLFRTGSTAMINTTASFPYFRSWIHAGREFESVKAQLSVLQSDFMLQSPALRLGHPLTPLDAALDEGGSSASADPANSIAPSTATPSMSSIGLSRAMLLLECEELPLLNGSMQLFSGGFCFKTPHMIPILVSFAKHVTSFRVLSTLYEELVLLQLELSETKGITAISHALPFSTTSRTIAFPLLAGTRFQEEIVRALATWKTTAETLDIPFFRPHDLTQFEGMTPRDDRGSNAEVSPVMAKTCAGLVRKASAASASDASTIEKMFPRWFIPKDTSPSTTLPKPKTDRSKIMVPITVVLGLPGSSASSIASTICSLSSADNDWERIDVDCRDSDDSKLSQDEFAFAQTQKRVGAALQRILDARSSELPPRILLCVVGYVDSVTIAAALKRSRASWPLQTKIASVIGCVSALNAYLPDALGAQCALPRLFDQLTAGFATHVVVTHSSDVPSSALGRLRYHIDQVNPFADINVLSSDVFEGTLSSLLSIDRFESAYYKNYRDAHFPDWESSHKTIHSEIDPARRPTCFLYEIAPGIEKTRFLHSVGKTLTPFAVSTKSIDKIHPMDPQMMARQQAGSGGIRIAQSLAAEKVLQQERQQQHDCQAEYGECWSVEATVSFAGDPETVYEYVSTGSYARMRVKNQGNRPDAKNAETLEIKITGRELNAGKIQELILGCYIKLDGAVQPLRSKVTLSLQEKREIQKQHIMDDLPEGFYYDGISYVDQFGGRHEFHPRMNEFVEDHVRKLNEQTTKHNAKVEENRKTQQAFVRQVV